MKRFVLIACLFATTVPTLQSQVSSSCAIPPILAQEYGRDFVNLAMTAMDQAASPDTALVHVPPAWLDPIAEGIAAIYNATVLPERDSVFNMYCVHDNTSPIQTYSGYLIEVDSTYGWTQAWQNMQTMTGNAPLDSLLVTYDLTLTNYFNWSFGHYALLHSDSLWNNYALIDSLETIAGIIHGEPDAIVGSAGRITHWVTGNDRYYDFYFEFNDCFDGCDNHHVWHFKVTPDCSVDYLGFDDWGFFGVQPLPAPINCNISTAVVEGLVGAFRVYPNPTLGRVTVMAAGSDLAPAQVRLYDLTGRIVSTSGSFTASTEVSLEGLGAGMYSLVILQEGKAVAMHRVVKE